MQNFFVSMLIPKCSCYAGRMKCRSTTLIFAGVILFAPNAFGEGYICSQEMSRFDRPGEIETSIYTRNGKIFKNNFEWIFEIVTESDSILTLIHPQDGYGMLVQIDKNSKEYGELYYSMEEFRKHPPSSLTYGKCLEID